MTLPTGGADIQSRNQHSSRRLLAVIQSREASTLLQLHRHILPGLLDAMWGSRITDFCLVLKSAQKCSHRTCLALESSDLLRGWRAATDLLGDPVKFVDHPTGGAFMLRRDVTGARRDDEC